MQSDQLQDAAAVQTERLAQQAFAPSLLASQQGSRTTIVQEFPGTSGPISASYVTRQAEAALSNEFNLGSLASGIVKQSVSGGVSTPAIAVADTDYGSVNSASQSTLSSAFALSSASGTFDDTGLSVSLPSVGTYLLFANVRANITVSTGTYGYIVAKLRNSTDSSDISNSETLAFIISGTTNTQMTVSVMSVVTVAAAKTIKLYASRNFDGTLSASSIESDSGGRTRLSYLKVSN